METKPKTQMDLRIEEIERAGNAVQASLESAAANLRALAELMRKRGR